MADFALLKRAVAGGAWTLMGKPFYLADLSSVLQTAATMLAARKLSQTMREGVPSDTMTITRRGDTPVTAEDIARTIRFATQSGADDDTAYRRLPIVVYELLVNARTHGAEESPDYWYRLHLAHDACSMHVHVSDSGRGFAWQKGLSRIRSQWNKSKATGLQLVTALCGEIEFSDAEFTASCALSKASAFAMNSADFAMAGRR
jgi:anti-sigma regulatory factor (Ser/Thr protein kinase)